MRAGRHIMLAGAMAALVSPALAQTRFPITSDTPPAQYGQTFAPGVYLVDPVTKQPVSPGGGGGGGGTGGTVTQGPGNDGTSPWNVRFPTSPSVLVGIYNSTLPTLSSGTSAPVAIDANGKQLIQGGNSQAVKTDGSAVTQPVSGTLNQGTPGASSAPWFTQDNQLHTDITNSVVPTGSKGAPATTGVSLLTVGLPWVPSTAVEACHVYKSGAGLLFRLAVTIGPRTGYVMYFDAASAPADGAVTPKLVRPVGSNGTLGFLDDDFNFTPFTFSTGLTVCFSSTGPLTKTADSSAFYSAQLQ